MTQPNDFIVIYCTCPDEEVAGRIADALVERRIAACVNILPAVQSVYRWQGNIQREQEVLLIIKARKASFDTISESVQRLHPYELPELIAMPLVHGLPGYLTWLERETNEGIAD